MKIIVEATPEEIGKLLQVIASALEQQVNDQITEKISLGIGSETNVTREF